MPSTPLLPSGAAELRAIADAVRDLEAAIKHHQARLTRLCRAASAQMKPDPALLPVMQSLNARLQMFSDPYRDLIRLLDAFNTDMRVTTEEIVDQADRHG